MLKSLHISPEEECLGCLQCEMACSYENYGVFATAKSRIKGLRFSHLGRKVPCTPAPSAMRALVPARLPCPEAITVDKATGAKVVNEATCVGCKVYCISCPFGTINYVAETGRVQV